jgi:hypothetical protein
MKSLFTSTFFALITTIGVSQNKSYISTEKAIEDIDYMIKTIEEIHYNPYFSLKKEEFNKIKAKKITEFDQDSISLKRFVATGMKLVAQISGGHTAMDWQNPNIMPELKTYQFIPFAGKLTANNQHFVVTRSTTSEIKKGTVIKSINGVNMVGLYKECMSYLGGIESFKNVSCEKGLPLFLFFTEKISAPYSIEMDGEVSDFKTSGIDISELISFISQNQPKENYTFQILKDNIGLISYNSCEDYKVFNKFLKETFKVIKEKKITKLIIDISKNGGGNSELNDLLLSYITTTSYQQLSGRFWKVSNQAKVAYKSNPIYEKNFGKKFMKQYHKSENQSIIQPFEEGLTQPKKPNNYYCGKTCILIGPNTFSSANLLADAVKTYKLSTLIGSATGEYTNDFGEQLNFTLPNSGNYIYVSSTYDIGANGNPNLFEPVYPDIKVQDDVLKFAINWIKKDTNKLYTK